MSLETGDYISELDRTNPVNATDPVGEGDDHLRLIKKCLQNSFPAFVGTAAAPKSVSLSEDQINDAALKSAANTFTANQEIDAALTFPNDRSINMRETGGTSRKMVWINSSNEFNCGTGPLPSVFNGSSVSIQHSGIVSAITATRANGSLQIADSGGTFGNVAAVHKAQTFAAVNRFNNTVEIANNVVFAGRNVADNLNYVMTRIDGADRLQVGEDAVSEIRQRANTLQTFYINGVASMQATTQAAGSLYVFDRGSVAKKAGFRNPQRVEYTQDVTMNQDWEGQWIEHASTVTTGRTWILPTGIEAGTTFRAVNRSPTHSLTISPSGIALEWYTGNGRQTGARTLAPGAIAEIYFLTAGTAGIFGNGIS